MSKNTTCRGKNPCSVCNCDQKENRTTDDFRQHVRNALERLVKDPLSPSATSKVMAMNPKPPQMGQRLTSDLESLAARLLLYVKATGNRVVLPMIERIVILLIEQERWERENHDGS